MPHAEARNGRASGSWFPGSIIVGALVIAVGLLHLPQGWASFGATPEPTTADTGLHFESLRVKSVAISGDTAVLGAAPEMPSVSSRGPVYVFTRSGDTWSQQAELTPSGAPQEDWFGDSVAISGDTIVVGAPLHDQVTFLPDGSHRPESGAVFVFTRNGGQWTEEAKLTVPGADWFGGAVAISGNTVVVGAYLDDFCGMQSGSLYVFSRTDGGWSQPQRLNSGPCGSQFLAFFGDSVAISGDTIVSGALNFDGYGRSRGAVHVFTRTGGVWSEQQKLTASDTSPGDRFGHSVALYRDTLVVGAPYGQHGTPEGVPGGLDPGAAYVFTRTDGVWSERQKLFPSDSAQEDWFGAGVAIWWDTIVIGSWARVSSPSVYAFTPGNTGWTMQEKLTDSAPLESNRGLAIWGNTVLVRADNGGAYVFDVPAVSVSVASPNPGPVVVEVGPTGDVPDGYALVGLRFSITAPSASVENPLGLVFSIPSSAVPSGTGVGEVAVFRDGVMVEACTGAPMAIPDPCVSNRAAIDWDFVITVLTSQASDWTFGVVAPAVGLVDPSTGLWHLRSSHGIETSFYYGNPGDYPFMGDWNCDGIQTPGLYRQSDGFVYLRNSNTQGIADITFFFGNPGDVPIAGDFNANGCDTVSIYRPSNQTFYIINALGANDGGLGAAEFSYVFGNPGDKPFVGDFNGNGQDTVGLHRESTGLVYFRNSHTQGVADHQFFFGDPGDRFVAGDWNGDGIDTPGVFRPSNTTFYFRFTNTQGVADHQFTWGQPGWLPVAGRFGLD